MAGKQPDAGVEIQRDLPVKITHHSLHQLFYQVTVDLEERSRAHAKRFLSHLIGQRGLADGIFWQLISSLGVGGLRKKRNSLNLRRFCLQARCERTMLRSVPR